MSIYNSVSYAYRSEYAHTDVYYAHGLCIHIRGFVYTHRFVCAHTGLAYVHKSEYVHADFRFALANSFATQIPPYLDLICVAKTKP